MEPVHREKILSNIDNLVGVLDYENFVDLCVKKQILSESMRDDIDSDFGNETDRKIALWKKITKRGPKAFAKVLDICEEHYPNAYVILNKSTGRNLGQMASVSGQPGYTQLDEPDMNLNNRDGACVSLLKSPKDLPVLKPYDGPIVNHLNLTVKKSTKIHKSTKLQNYKMCSRNRGVLLLINIIKFKNEKLTRHGANYDRDNLIYLFKELGFTIYYYEDIKQKDMFLLLDALQQEKSLETTECFVFGIMTHGNLDHHSPFVEFGNGENIRLDSILEVFYNSNFYSLMLKPKIFILPFCRGNKADIGVYVQNVQRDGTVNIHPNKEETTAIKITTKSDILVCYATVKGFESHRNIDHGSWYIQALCQIWAENAHDTDVETMMKMVDTLMREEKGKSQTNTVQTASSENMGFNKALFLNPGFYEEDNANNA